MLEEKFKKYYGSKYSLEHKLHKSNMSVIFKGVKLDTQEPVAIKIHRPQVNDPETSIKRFFLEPKLLSEFNHPNIVKVLEIDGSNGINYFSLEYINSKDLYKTVQSRGPVSIEKGIEIIKQINSALKYVHKLGKIHRDIKTSNIMVDRSGRAVLIDFGIALDLHSNTRLTIKGDVFGTPEYMSPEQARGTKDVTKLTDVYSIGIVLYEIFTGKIPFRADNQIRTIELIKKMEPDPPRKYNNSIPKHINDTILKCLDKDPSERFQNIEDVSTALENDQSKPVSIEKKKSKTRPERTVDTKSTLTSKKLTLQKAIKIITWLVIIFVISTPAIFLEDTVLKVTIPLILMIFGIIVYLLLPKELKVSHSKPKFSKIKGKSFTDFFVPAVQNRTTIIPGNFKILYGSDKGKTFVIPGIKESNLIRSTLGRGSIEYPLSLSHIKVYDREDLRMISRYQMELFYNNSNVIIRNKSHNTPISINGNSLKCEEHKSINDGDVIEISKIKIQYSNK